MSTVVDIAELSFHHSGENDAGPALTDITLSVSAGEAVALLGPSGAGKTTLLTLLDGRLRDWRGHARVLGVVLAPGNAPPREARADVGFIFQEFALVERSSVARNVLNGRLGRTDTWRALCGLLNKEDSMAAVRAMTEAGIADLADRRVDSLSGGQRQRVAIARCLAQEPRLILADEPVSSLDPVRAEDILELITSASRARGSTTVFSSHQPDLARRFASRVIGLRGGCVVFDRPTDALTNDEIAELYRESAAPQPRVPVPLRLVL